VAEVGARRKGAQGVPFIGARGRGAAEVGWHR
jgi:hypothetical protein